MTEPKWIPYVGVTRRVEFALLRDDNSWTTRTFDVPVDDATMDRARTWADTNLAPMAEFRRVVMFAVYAIDPEEE